jgi:tRNA (adenine57-N1/adenine58-N1)-methyltransferase
MLIKKEDNILLLSKEKEFFANVNQKKLNLSEGILELTSVIGEKFGTKIKSHKGIMFSVVKPNLGDYFKKKLKRMPQVITQKDAGIILGMTCLENNAKVVEAGTGSAFATLFFAKFCNKGKVYSYEIREDFYKNAKKNIEKLNYNNIILKNKNILDGIDEKDVDIILLDMKKAEEAISLAFKSLKSGGYLVVYSPYIEQVKATVLEIEKLDFTNVQTIENILRHWDVREHTLPKRYGTMHTGFITFARKY